MTELGELNSYNYEIYTKDPVTGIGGWDIEFYNVFAKTKKEAGLILEKVPNFCSRILFNGEYPMSSLDVEAWANGANSRKMEITPSGGGLIW